MKLRLCLIFCIASEMEQFFVPYVVWLVHMGSVIASVLVFPCSLVAVEIMLAVLPNFIYKDTARTLRCYPVARFQTRIPLKCGADLIIRASRKPSTNICLGMCMYIQKIHARLKNICMYVLRELIQHAGYLTELENRWLWSVPANCFLSFI